LWLHRSDLHRP
jgi:hypothetical protein